MSSPCNGWAVGYYQNGLSDYTLIEHWNGTAWKRQPSPNPPGSLNDLYGVAAVSRTEAWAVGLRNGGTLIEHWNGKRWKLQRSPNPGGGDAALQGVAALSSRDVWAVGEKNPAKITFARTLVEHWNGKRWQAQPSPNPTIHNGIDVLNGVAAVSRTDAWAVGTDRRRLSGDHRTLIEHWNGRAWRVQPSPDPAPGDNELQGVAALSPTDAWAVGYSTHGNASWQPLIEHWNGRAWRVQPSHDSAPGPVNELQGVAAVSKTDAWAVGRANGAYPGTLIEHWNGKSWKVQQSPDPSSMLNDLFGVAAVSPTDAWVVGQYEPSSGPSELTLIGHWNGSAWTTNDR